MAGADEFRAFAADLQSESGRVGARAASVIRSTADAISRDAARDAPKGRTLKLSESIEVKVTGDGRTGTMRAVIEAGAAYGIFQELGTSKMRASPFLFPATDRHEEQYLKDLGDATAPRL